MKIFLAGHENSCNLPRWFVKYKAPYILQTFYDARFWNDDMVRDAITTPDMFMLDSGAFSFFLHGRSVEWGGYISEYIDFINRWDIQYFFELDIDALVGTDAVQEMTARIELETGKQAIPVFHQCRGMKWYHEACEKYEIISISASGLTAETRWTKNKDALRALIKIAHDAGTKVHGLGYTRLDNLNHTTVPFDSVDSSSVRSGSRYATVYKFTGNSLITEKITGRMDDYLTVDDFNTREWVKMCKFKAREDA